MGKANAGRAICSRFIFRSLRKCPLWIEMANAQSGRSLSSMPITTVKAMVLVNLVMVGFCAAAALILAFGFSPHLDAIARHVERISPQLAQLKDPIQLQRIAKQERDFNIRSLRSSAAVGYRLAEIFAGVLVIELLNAIYFHRLARSLVQTNEQREIESRADSSGGDHGQGAG